MGCSISADDDRRSKRSRKHGNDKTDSPAVRARSPQPRSGASGSTPADDRIHGGSSSSRRPRKQSVFGRRGKYGVPVPSPTKRRAGGGFDDGALCDDDALNLSAFRRHSSSASDRIEALSADPLDDDPLSGSPGRSPAPRGVSPGRSPGAQSPAAAGAADGGDVDPTDPEGVRSPPISKRQHMKDISEWLGTVDLPGSTGA